MAKSFILKGTRGEASGFLQHSGDVLRCKARCDGAQGMLLTLCFEDGEHRTLELAPDGSETQSPLEAKRSILCAYVVSEEKLLLWTDERAQRAFHREAERKQREAEKEHMRVQPRREEAPRIASRDVYGSGIPAEIKPQGSALRSSDPDITGMQDAQAHADVSGRWAQSCETQSGCGWRMPQRRWPPPVCWPSARYVAGEWTESPPEKAFSSSAR